MLRSLRNTLVLAIFLVFSLALWSSPAFAFVPFEGQFAATDSCEAVVSIKKGTNPDNVKLSQGQTYQVVAKNKDNPTHYLVDIAGANPPQRWVASSCFDVADASATNPATPETSVKPVVTGFTGQDYLLALSWQPAFCEGKPDKAECQILALNPDRPEATNFVLHGLWPQPKSNIFCGVSEQDKAFDEGNQKDWSKLPAVEKQLSSATWEKLQAVMPGTLSNLHRHEWIKHGTCYQGTPEEYFTEAIALTEAFNQSPVQKLVASHIGRLVAIKDIDQALSSFGETTGDKVEVKCKDSVLGEIWVNLAGDITLDTPVANLVAYSPNAKAEKFPSCKIDDARD